MMTAAPRSAGSCSRTRSIARMAPAEPTIATTSQGEESTAIGLEQDGSDQLSLFERIPRDPVEPRGGRHGPPVGVADREALGKRSTLVQSAERSPQGRLHRLC